MKSFLKAGTAIIDISPDKGIELAGYPHYLRHNTGIHDPLYASCIFMDNGKEKIAVVSLDIALFSKKYVKEVRKRAGQITGIPGENIMISCSHTHSGPWASGRLDMEGLEKGLMPDSGYLEGLIDKIVHIIKEASTNTFHAKAGMEKGYCGREQGVGGNRRNPEGVSDPDVCVLGISDKKGFIKACIVNYTLHPTLLHAESTLVSADYPGYIRQYLKRMEPGMVMLFTQGTSGNQSTRYFRNGQTFEEAERIGSEIGKEAYRVLKLMKMEDDIGIFSKSVSIDMITREFPSKEDAIKAVKKAKENLERIKQENAGYIAVQNADLKLLGAEDILGYILMLESKRKIELLEDEVPVEIQVMGIGNGRIAGLPGEIFVEFGLKIKENSPFENTFVFELSNGCLPGYAYTKKALEEGGYETDTSMLSEEMGEILVEKTLKLLKE